MKKRLIVIGLALAVCMPVTAQAEPLDYESVATTSMSVKSVTAQAEPFYAFKVVEVEDPGIMLAMQPSGGSLFDSDPATVVVAGAQVCGSCHSDNRDIPSGVHGGGTRAGITTS